MKTFGFAEFAAKPKDSKSSRNKCLVVGKKEANYTSFTEKRDAATAL